MKNLTATFAGSRFEAMLLTGLLLSTIPMSRCTHSPVSCKQLVCGDGVCNGS
jgi:hypothetical protein